MGLFDSFAFEPSAYDDTQGILARLLPNMFAQPDQTQAPAQVPNQNAVSSPAPVASQAPAPSLFDDSIFNPSNFAPSGPAPGGTPFYGQSQNVAVGGYQMPVFGQPDANSAAIPLNAKPTAGQIPDGPAAQQAVPQVPTQPNSPSVLPSFLQQPVGSAGFGDRLSSALQNFANANGPLQALAGGISGLANGQRTDAAGINNQNLRAQFAALVPVLGPQKAMLAVLNPEAGKTLLTEALTNKTKFGITGQDGFGRQTYGFINERNQTINGKPLSEQPAQDPSGGLGNMDLTGSDYLASLPKAAANTVQMMVEGRIAPPSSFALSKPYWQSMIAAAKNYDPTFDATQWSARVAGAKDFSAGKSAEMVRSVNQTIHHVGALTKSMDDLNNFNLQPLNTAMNYVGEKAGWGAPGAFRTNAHAVAEELSKVFKGANLSDSEIHAWEQNLHESMSPEQQRTQVTKLMELLSGSLHALEEKRLNSIGPLAAEKAGPLIKPEGQIVLDKVKRWAENQSGAPAAPAPAPTPRLKAGETANLGGGIVIKRVD